MQDEIIQDEEYIQQEPQDLEGVQDSTETQAYTQVRVAESDIDVAEPFFIGASIAATLCMLSIGVSAILRMIRASAS